MRRNGMRSAGSIALIAVLGFAGLTAARADDLGPRHEVRAVRYATQKLLAARVRAWGEDPSTMVVDDVVVTGDEALARWHTQAHRCTEHLVNSYGTWWEAPAHLADSSGNDACPTASTTQDGYVVTFTRRRAPATFVIGARRPSLSESWAAPDGSGNAYVYFTMTLATSGASAHFESGGTLAVWFPFVLDPSKDYTLSIAFGDPVIGPLHGMLRDNTLHFVLPAFSVPTGATLMGVIDGNSS